MAFSEKLKKFVNDAANSAGKAANSISDTSKKIAEKTKLKHRISNEESTIKGNYYTIGKRYFEADGNISKEEFEEIFTSINTSKAEIENLKARIEAIDGTSKCPTCGKDVPTGVKFCSNCGTANPSYKEPEKEQPAETVDAEVVEEPKAEESKEETPAEDTTAKAE